METIKKLYEEMMSSSNEDKTSLWNYYEDEKLIIKSDEAIKALFDEEKRDHDKEYACFIKSFLEVKSGDQNFPMIKDVDNLKPDRKRHIVSLFYLGHILYHKSETIKENVNSQLEKLNFPLMDSPQRNFSFMWYILCLFHDLGYAIEDPIKNNLSVVDEKKNYSMKMPNDFIPLIFTDEIIRKYHLYRKCRWNTYDHGIWGGKIFLEKMIELRNSIENIVDERRKVFWTKNADHIYEYAAWIIACHNICYDNGKSRYTDCYLCSKLDSLIKEKPRCLSLKNNPLFFLFCLADTLEPTKILKETVLYSNLKMDINDNKICFQLPDGDDMQLVNDYKEKLKDMNEWLIDVPDDLIIRLG